MRRLIGSIVLLGIAMSLMAQQKGVMTGIVKTSGNVPVAFASIAIEGSVYGGISDDDGRFSFGVPMGKHTLVVSAIGYTTHKRVVTIASSKTPPIDVMLDEELTELNEVRVAGKSNVQRIREQAFNITAIDAKLLHNTSSDINQVLNRTTGVRVRESGGMGSGFSFSINGFSGNQVKFFLDGIPLDNFGSTLSLSNIPINMAERIDVYKGVVPVSLGADALGGAVNVVTNQKVKNYLDASYSVGSFNTHRASVNVRRTSNLGWVFNANAFVNYSDNNYDVNVSVADPLTGVFGQEQKYSHFHDGYRSATILTDAGIINKPFADQLLVGMVASGQYKETQQGSNMQKVVGDAFTDNKSYVPSLRYVKTDFLTTGLDLKAYTSLYLAQNSSVDTSSMVYDWTGKATPRRYGDNKKQGELGEKTIYRYDERNWLNSANVRYAIAQQHQLTINHNHNAYLRDERDDYNPDRYGLNSPSITKHITGVEYQWSTPDKQLTVMLFGKNYWMESDLVIGDTLRLSTSSAHKGYGVAATWHLSQAWLLKSSYENACRLPQPSEILGNGLSVNANPNLKPEKSHNINVSMALQKNVSSNLIGVEGGFIFRNASNFIRNKVDGSKSIYENLSSVQVTGAEAALRFKHAEWFTFDINGTWQKMINNDRYEPGTQKINYVYRLQVPNVPYLFGNADLGIYLKELLSQNDAMTFNWGINFVEAFYLYWPSQGDPEYKKAIPRQLTHNAGIGYALAGGKYNVSVDCRNITNTKVYDFFNVQKPGRSVSVKLRYFIN